MDVANMLCVVTGANSGIGKETAPSFAADGAYIIMICRNEQRARNARQDIIENTGNTGVQIIIADLSVQCDVRSAADKINHQFDQINILINNSGLITNEREETIDGIEKTLAVNHLAPFLLTNLLWDSLQLTENYSPMRAYGISKLCNIMVYPRAG